MGRSLNATVPVGAHRLVTCLRSDASTGDSASTTRCKEADGPPSSPGLHQLRDTSRTSRCPASTAAAPVAGQSHLGTRNALGTTWRPHVPARAQTIRTLTSHRHGAGASIDLLWTSVSDRIRSGYATTGGRPSRDGGVVGPPDGQQRLSGWGAWSTAGMYLARALSWLCPPGLVQVHRNQPQITYR